MKNKVIAICISVLLTTSCANAEYLDPLILKDVAHQHVDTGKGDPGWTEFELVNDYRFKGPDGKLWTVPAGTVVNGSSIPRPVWSLMTGPWSGKHRNASVIHDWMCDRAIESSSYAHRLFYEAMRETGVSFIKARTMYIAVRKYGPQWEKGASFGLEPVVHVPKFDNAQFDELVQRANKENLTIDQLEAILQ